MLRTLASKLASKPSAVMGKYPGFWRYTSSECSPVVRENATKKRPHGLNLRMEMWCWAREHARAASYHFVFDLKVRCFRVNI